MKTAVLTCALAVSLTAHAAFAGNLIEPVVEPPVIVEETAAGSSGGIILPLVILLLIGVAVASGGGSTIPVLPEETLMSDERLKTDVIRVGTTVHDLPLYQYRYVFGAQRYEGVMAQDVMQVRPDAVHQLASGHLAVNYGALGIESRAVD